MTPVKAIRVGVWLLNKVCIHRPSDLVIVFATHLLHKQRLRLFLLVLRSVVPATSAVPDVVRVLLQTRESRVGQRVVAVRVRFLEFAAK